MLMWAILRIYFSTKSRAASGITGDNTRLRKADTNPLAALDCSPFCAEKTKITAITVTDRVRNTANLTAEKERLFCFIFAVVSVYGFVKRIVLSLRVSVGYRIFFLMSDAVEHNYHIYEYRYYKCAEKRYFEQSLRKFASYQRQDERRNIQTYQKGYRNYCQNLSGGNLFFISNLRKYPIN